MKNWGDTFLSKESKCAQIIGSIFKHPVLFVLSAVSIVGTVLCWRNEWVYYLLVCTPVLILILLIESAKTLSTIFTLRKEELWITRTQIAILVYVLLLVLTLYVYSGLCFGSAVKDFIPGTAVCSVLGWIFQDSIKGAATFVKFRSKGLLNIGDWIKLDKSGVDGRIKNISLTSISIENWDSTTSSIPMSVLYSEQLQNLQMMNDGRTNGRRMLKEIIIDSSRVHPIDKNDVIKLGSILGNDDPFFQSQVKDKEGRQNIQVYREYLNYYLHEHPRVSHEPRLMVRWMKHSQEGLTLQMYAFLMDTTFVGFDKTQSEIFEHAIESLAWFGLRLYQTPSSYDSRSSTIYLANKYETE